MLIMNFFVLVMEFETLKQIEEYEAGNVLTDEQRRVLFQRRMQIFLRIHQWRDKNDLTDTWTPEQHERFLRDWQDDEVLNQVNHGEKRTHDEMMDEEEPSTSYQGASQTGRGDDHERPFYVESVRQVYTKKFRTNATSYQVHFLLHSNQLDKPIHFPFMSAGRLTMEHILAKFKQVIQSNQEFRLNDTVEINMIHVSMPIGGKRSKRTEVNLEKHMEKKRSVVRIRNDDNLCMARALAVAKAKLDDPCDRQIRDHHWPMQTRLVKVWSDA